MTLRRRPIIGALLGGCLLGSGAGWGAPNTFNTALPVATGNVVWREQVVLRERSSGGPVDRDVSVTALVNVLGYGVDNRLAVFGAVPYFFDKELNAATPMDRAGREADGFGDLTIFGRYMVLQRDWTGRTFRVAPLLGITAPTGDDDDRDRFGELPRPLQAGDGAWDGFFGVVATYQTLEYQVDAQLLYRDNGRDGGFAAGDEARFDASLQYRIWPPEPQAGTRGFAYALLESNLVHRERNEIGSVTDADSGGTQWLLAPGLQYVTARWIVEATVQLPAAGDPNREALEDDYIVRAGFRVQF